MRSQQEVASLIKDAQALMGIKETTFAFFSLNDSKIEPECCPLGMALCSVFGSFRQARLAFQWIRKDITDYLQSNGQCDYYADVDAMVMLLNINKDLALAINNAHVYEYLSATEIVELLENNNFDVSAYANCM